MGGGALVFHENGASVAISFKITNTGNSPATNLTPHAWLHIQKKSGGTYAWQEQQERCGGLRSLPFNLGFTLFPEESFPRGIGVGTWSLGVNASRKEVEDGRSASADGKHLLMQVVGCIDYTFPTDATTHHQTGFILDLSKNTPFFWIGPDEARIPIENLMLRESGVGSGHYAD